VNRIEVIVLKEKAFAMQYSDTFLPLFSAGRDNKSNVGTSFI
jgi:hypothetical protein